VRTAARLLPAVRRWLDFLEGESDELIRPAEGYGDWLSLDAETPKDLIGTAYFAHSCRLATELATAAGDTGLAEHARALGHRVRDAFRRRFVAGGGAVAGDTQTAYVLALQAGLLDPDEVPNAAARLVRRLEQRAHHLSTGFLGTPWLLDALTQAGHRDEAFRLLLQDTFPSWLYQVRSGATTMWERWDTWTDAKGFSTSYTTEGRRTIEMNSLNHYAYGAVGDWMYREIGALESVAPGYRHVRVHPRPAGGITWARTHHEAPAGRVAVEWEVRPGGLAVAVDVPPAAGATVVLDAAPERIREGGRQLGDTPGVEKLTAGPDRTEIAIGSGGYRFEVDGGVE
jgi:alpha-L-rhamnosidase